MKYWIGIASALLLAAAPLVKPLRAAQGFQAEIVGMPAPGRSGIQFIGAAQPRFVRMTRFGYLTHIEGIRETELFFGGKVGTVENARFTYFAADLVNGSDVVGTTFTLRGNRSRIGIYQRLRPGASFDVPDSFKDGHQIVAFDGEYQEVGTGHPQGTGTYNETDDLEVESVSPFAAGGKTVQLGRLGLGYRLSASGAATVTTPLPFIEANFTLGGSMDVLGGGK